MARPEVTTRTLKNIFLVIGIGGLVFGTIKPVSSLVGVGSLIISCFFQTLSDGK